MVRITAKEYVQISKQIQQLIDELENDPGWFYNNNNRLALETWFETDIIPIINNIKEYYDKM